jgi:hypothetical protein
MRIFIHKMATPSKESIDCFLRFEPKPAAPAVTREMSRLTTNQYEFLKEHYSDKGFVANPIRQNRDVNAILSIADRNWQEVLRKDPAYGWDWRKDSEDQKAYAVNCDNAAHGIKNAAEIDAIVFPTGAQMSRLTPKQLAYLEKNYADKGFVSSEERLKSKDNPIINVSDRIWQEVLKGDPKYVWKADDEAARKENYKFGPHNAAKELDKLVFGKYKHTLVKDKAARTHAETQKTSLPVYGLHNDFGRIRAATDTHPVPKPGNDYESYCATYPALVAPRRQEGTGLKVVSSLSDYEGRGGGSYTSSSVPSSSGGSSSGGGWSSGVSSSTVDRLLGI